MWYTYTIEYYSTIKKKNNAICSNMDGPRDCHTEWSKSEKEKYHMTPLESKKKWYKWTYLKNTKIQDL